MQMYYLTLSNSFGPIGTIKYFEIVLSERKMRLTGNMKIFLTVIKPRLPIQVASVSWRVSFSNGKWVFEDGAQAHWVTYSPWLVKSQIGVPEPSSVLAVLFLCLVYPCRSHRVTIGLFVFSQCLGGEEWFSLVSSREGAACAFNIASAVMSSSMTCSEASAQVCRDALPKLFWLAVELVCPQLCLDFLGSV